MRTLQLTSDERAALLERVRDEKESNDNETLEFDFKSFDDVSLIIEYTDNEIILSFKIENMTTKIPESYLGCPSKLNELVTEDITRICDELETFFFVELKSQIGVDRANFTMYNWREDTAWYLYELKL